jgi:hypothetical protein
MDAGSVLLQRSGAKLLAMCAEGRALGRNIPALRTAFPVFSLLFFYRCLQRQSKSIVHAHGQ